MSGQNWSANNLNSLRKRLPSVILRQRSLEHAPATSAAARPDGLVRAFGNLRVRPKLMVLHNLFFLVLACAIYFSLVPLFERQVYDARLREFDLLRDMLDSEPSPARLNRLPAYDFRTGTAGELAIPANALAWLDSHPGQTWADPRHSVHLYQKDRNSGVYRRLRAATTPFADVLSRAQLTLFMVLGAIYIAAVLLLETVMMPIYVYRPLRVMLDADQATHRGDRERELIPDEYILGDEVGQIMRSRNSTVSELRDHEDDLAAALRKLEEQDRLASLGLLSASVAHELNTPLAVLHGSIEKLKETTADPHTLGRLSRMERVTQRLRNISESLLDFARDRKLQMAPHALRPIVEDAWQLVGIDERAAGVKFRNEVRLNEIITGNPDRLIQVFVNLLRNALYAVKSSDERPAPEIAVCSRPISASGRAWISVTVEDNGPGIPAGVLPDIFEAFVTTRLDARGTGLGLAVTEGIVTQHGGTITACNRPEGGARIEVRFPGQPFSVPAAQLKRA